MPSHRLDGNKPCSGKLALSLSLIAALCACDGKTPAASDQGGDLGVDVVVAPLEDASLPAVDTAPPPEPLELEITSPARGATLTGEATIEVQGKVTGALSSLQVNGHAVQPLADGSFGHLVNAEHGMNLIVVEAVDGEGDEQRHVQSFYYSTQWLQTSFDDPTSAMMPDAVVGWLGQPVFDDGDATTTNDFASVLQHMLASLDLSAMVAGTQRIRDVAGCDHADVTIKNVRYNPPQVSLEVNEGELVVTLTITGFEAGVDADLDGPWYNPACLIGVSGKVKASAITITAKVAISVDQGVVLAQANQSTAVVSGFDIDISGVWGFLTNWLVNTFEDDLADDLEAQLASELDQQLGPALQEGLGALSIDERFEIPPLIGSGDPVVAQLSSRLEAFDLLEDGARYAMAATAVAEAKSGHASLGSIAHDACGAGTSEPLAFSEPKTYPLQLALKDDLINQLFYSMHQGGVLQATITSEDVGDQLGSVGITDFDGKLDALLPPMINTCAADGGALLQIGDLGLTMRFSLIGQPVEMQLYLSFEAPLDLGVVQQDGEQRLSFAMGEVSRLEVHSQDISSEGSPIYETVERLVRAQLVPELVASLADQSTSFAIPAIDLSSLHESIPAGTRISFDVARVEQRNGYSVVVGKVAAAQ